MELKFDPKVCFSCKSIDCLLKCRWNFYSFEEAKREIEKIAIGKYSKVLEECKNCYACEEFCEYKNHPFYRIVELQEYFGIKKLEKERIEDLISKYKAEGEFVPKKGEKFVHICLFPELKDKVTKTFEGFEVVRGRHVFCNLVYLHYGVVSVIKDRANKIIENMKKLGGDFILLHDECYGFYNSFAKAYGLEVPFKFIHYFEYFYNKIKSSKVKKLNLRIAYQKPCSNFLSPEMDKILDKIFEAIGVERVKRKYDRERALCCGAAFILSGDLEKADELKRKNVEDVEKLKVDAMVFNCPMCYRTLAKDVEKLGIRALMVIDLCKEALE
ncbi:MAG: (Fe-S)-binding protein [Archaeoglobaceae archaeon]|nr:(Fe-S)-binding protein [Archaeoglobaceae archaeon]MCX8151771.1 (Fe-S)-binding protein [Archaeoglobaceae archaeon]MDW8013204.1 (Fe-S)-binding protein [Archaeoglobaceae archaeon]